MRKVATVWAALWMCVGATHGLAQTLTDAVYGKGGGSFEVWADQRSNALPSSFLNSLYRGGFLDGEMLQGVVDAHPGMGGMGLSAGWSKRWSTHPVGQLNAKGKKEWALAGSFGSEVLVSSLWRRELLDLVFMGNAGHTGRVDPLTGTGIRVGVFNRFSLGVEHLETRQRFELGLVQRAAGAEFGVLNGSFWVSEAADSMSFFMQSYGSVSLDQLPDSSGFQASHILPAYGVGVSGSLPLSSELWPLHFRVDFQDVGVLWEPPGGLLAVVDTGFATTGLPALGEGWTWETLLNDGVPTSPEELVLSTDCALGRLLMLPASVNAHLQWWPNPELQLQARLRGGRWMPVPEYALGVGWIPSGRFAVGVDVRNGGWGGLRPVTWAKLRVSPKRVLTVEVDDPLGWAWQSEWAANTYGRGVRVKLERLPGLRWTQFAGFNSRDLPAKKPRKKPDPSVRG